MSETAGAAMQALMRALAATANAAANNGEAAPVSIAFDWLSVPEESGQAQAWVKRATKSLIFIDGEWASAGGRIALAAAAVFRITPQRA